MTMETSPKFSKCLWDVTQLKRLQQGLQRREEEYRYLFENAPCYLTVVDADFNIVQTNKQFDADFGAHMGDKCFRVYKKRDCRCDNCPVEKTFLDERATTPKRSG